jgi:hypothetical protein
MDCERTGGEAHNRGQDGDEERIRIPDPEAYGLDMRHLLGLV